MTTQAPVPQSDEIAQAVGSDTVQALVALGQKTGQLSTEEVTSAMVAAELPAGLMDVLGVECR